MLTKKQSRPIEAYCWPTGLLRIKGPDNPTNQLLPIISTTFYSGDREGRKDKGGGGEKIVCDKGVCVCVKDGVVKDGVRQKRCGERWCVTKLCVKDGVSKMVCDKVVCERWCEKVM